MKINKKAISDKTVTNLLYVLAVIVVLAVFVLTVFAFASRDNGKKSKTTTTTSFKSVTVTTTAKATEKATVTTKKSSTPPVIDVDNETPEFVMPCSGTPGKQFDIKALTYSLTMNDYRAHTGLDIAAETGSAVTACEDGRVTGVYKDYLMGSCVSVDHGDGIISIYKNLAEEVPDGIVEGCSVSKGQTIGFIGSSALAEMADAPHLHLEFTVNGVPADPLDYISYTEETMKTVYEDSEG